MNMDMTSVNAVLYGYLIASTILSMIYFIQDKKGQASTKLRNTVYGFNIATLIITLYLFVTDVLVVQKDVLLRMPAGKDLLKLGAPSYVLAIAIYNVAILAKEKAGKADAKMVSAGIGLNVGAVVLSGLWGLPAIQRALGGFGMRNWF
jgi:uncharacterized membrane protein